MAVGLTQSRNPKGARASPPNVTKISWSSESARGLAQSKSWRLLEPAVSSRSVLDCASPLALWEGRF